jgi:hypothetical protein
LTFLFLFNLFTFASGLDLGHWDARGKCAGAIAQNVSGANLRFAHYKRLIGKASSSTEARGLSKQLLLLCRHVLYNFTLIVFDFISPIGALGTFLAMLPFESCFVFLCYFRIAADAPSMFALRPRPVGMILTQCIHSKGVIVSLVCLE